MTTPTLALGISAAGAAQVAQLASSVQSLRQNLEGLARAGTGGAINNLDALTKEFREMRQELNATLQGLRTDLAGNFQKAFDAAAKQVKAGGDQVEGELKKAQVKIRTAASPVQLGDGVKSMISISGFDKASVLKKQQEISQSAEAIAASHEAAAAKEAAARAKAAEMLIAAESKITLQIVASEIAERKKMLDNQRKLADQAAAAESELTQRMIAADIAAAAARQRVKERLSAQAMAEEAALTQRMIAADIAENSKRARERQAQVDKTIAEEAALTQRLIAADITEFAKRQQADEALRRAEADYLARNARGQLRTQIRARSFLDSGVAPSTVESRFGTSAVAGALSASSLDAMKKSLDEMTTKAPKAAGAMASLSHEMSGAHSAARGLASGFGAIWLTWGQIAPLLAGAALSHGFVETIKTGAEVQNTFTAIRVLAGESAESVAALNQQALDLARNSQFGPGEMAKAMKTLALAGQDASQVFESVRSVTNFAVAGDTDITKAADVMTTVATAFNVSARDFNYIGDVIAKAAAESKASVESMGEAFKTASVINQQYGVSLEDTAVSLALVNNAGIQGTAAGTALRNMFADLAGRTPKVQNALDQLGVQTIDPLTGKMRGLQGIFVDLNAALEKRTPTAQFKFLQDIFSERGGKEAIAVLNAMRRTAEEAGDSVTSVFDKLAAKVNDSAGFTARAAAEMSLTPLNQLKSVATNLQATLVETFSSLQNDVLSFSSTMKQVFASDEFKSTLRELMQLIADITLTVVEHGRQILTVIAIYASMRSVVGVLAAVQAGVTALSAATAAGMTTIAGASRAAALANPIFAGLTAALMAGAAAWLAYKLNADGGKTAVDNFNNSAPALLEKLQEEENRLKRVNEARILGISLMELEARAAIDKARGNEPEALVKARAALSAFDASDESKPVRGKLPWESQQFYNDTIGGEPARRRKALVDQVNAAEQNHLATLARIEESYDNIARINREAADDVRNVQNIQAHSQISGTLGNPTGKPAKMGMAGPHEDNTLRTLDSEMRNRESVLKNSYDSQMRLLESKHRNELLSENTYQLQVLSLSEKFEAQSRKLIEDTLEAEKAAYDKRKATLQADPKLQKDPAGLKSALENLENEYSRIAEVAKSQLAKATMDSFVRQRLAVDELEGSTRKLVKANDDYWDKAVAQGQKEAALADVRRNSLGLSEEERVALEARTKVAESHTVELQKLQLEYTKATLALTEFNAEASGGDWWSQEKLARYDALREKVEALRAAVDKGSNTLAQLEEQAAASAVTELQNKKIDDFSKAMADSMAESILSGGKDGGRKLKDWLKNYFIKEPLTIMLQGFVKTGMQQLGSSFVGNMFGGGAGGAGGAGGSMMNMIGQGIGTVSSFFGGSAATATTSTGLGLLGAEEAAAYGVAGTGIMGTIGVAMPYLAAALFAAQALGLFDHGGPKTESGYGAGVPLRGDPASAKSAAEAISSQYKSIATSLGVKPAQLDMGVFSAKDPQGTAMTQLAVNASLNGQNVYSREKRLGGIENVGRSDSEFTAAVAEETARATLAAIKATDGLSDAIRRSIGGVDAYASSIEDINKAMANLTVAQQLEDRLFNLTATDLEKLNRARQRESSTIDAVNQKLLAEVYAAEDVETAKQKLLRAYDRESSTVQQSVSSLQSFAEGLRNFVKELFTGDNFGPSAATTAARSAYRSTLSAASLGNEAARSNLTKDAGTYLQNLKNTASSSFEYQFEVAKVAGELTTLAAGADAQATLQQQQLDVQKQQLEQLKLLSDTEVSYAQAWAEYTDSVAKLEAAKAARAAEPIPVVPVTAPSAPSTTPAPVMPDPETWSPNAFAAGGSHAGGARIVGEAGSELEITGPSRILNHTDTERMFAEAANLAVSEATAEMAAEIKDLRNEIRALTQHAYTTASVMKEFRDRGTPVRNNDQGDKIAVV